MFPARPAIIVVATCAALYAALTFNIANTAEAESVEVAEVVFRIDRHGTVISISGPVSSTAHQAILQQITNELYPDDEQRVDLSHQGLLPPGWALVSELTLRAMATTYSSTATLKPDSIEIQGFSSDMDRWLIAENQLKKNLLSNMQLSTDVVEVQPYQSSQSLCVEVFNRALETRRINFPADSDVLATTAYALLDELVEISANCPEASIRVTGHTDVSGDENHNIRLSEKRANAVARYMTERGIDENRLITSGLGSGRPLLDANNRRARTLNRRIEIALSYP